MSLEEVDRVLASVYRYLLSLGGEVSVTGPRADADRVLPAKPKLDTDSKPNRSELRWS